MVVQSLVNGNSIYKGIYMPTMIRPKGKATNIAYKILGTPQNIAHKETKKEFFVNRRLLYEETHKVR